MEIQIFERAQHSPNEEIFGCHSIDYMWVLNELDEIDESIEKTCGILKLAGTWGWISWNDRRWWKE